ncbi:hypothetical protein, partial [Escherichia coli]|uniref:hypothetical protein n=1 Tax=Escherichia coli TaxID=562 RepID=UPI003EE3A496
KCPDGIPVFPDKNGSSGKRSHDKTNRTEQRPDSAWEGLRIRISDLVDGPLRSVTQWLTRVLEKITS